MNNTQNRTVVFITHDAFRAGAPIILLNFLKWLKSNTDIPFMVLVREAGGAQGELVPEFEALAPTFAFARRAGRLRRLAGAFGVVGNERRGLLRRLKQAGVGLIYSNTVVNGDVLEYLAPLGCPVITHVHELNHWIAHHVGEEEFAKVTRRTDRYIAVSAAVKANLVNNHAIPSDSIDVVHGFVPPMPTCDYGKLRDVIRSEHGIPPDAFIVGGSGTTDWRKGPDLFVQMARAVSRLELPKPVHFVWVGGAAAGLEYWRLMHDVELAGLAGTVHFVGVKRRPYDYFTMFDVFALTSREDPFPLVMLETAYLGIPTVCFNGAGGTPEFVADDCGFAVPYLDIGQMADRIALLLGDEKKRAEFGRNAEEKIKRGHLISTGAQALVDVINRVMTDGMTRGGQQR